MHAFVLEAAVEPASRLSTARLKKNGATRPAGGIGVSSALNVVVGAARCARILHPLAQLDRLGATVSDRCRKLRSCRSRTRARDHGGIKVELLQPSDADSVEHMSACIHVP